jgi:hypothetical protein
MNRTRLATAGAFTAFVLACGLVVALTYGRPDFLRDDELILGAAAQVSSEQMAAEQAAEVSPTSAAAPTTTPSVAPAAGAAETLPPTGSAASRVPSTVRAAGLTCVPIMISARPAGAGTAASDENCAPAGSEVGLTAEAFDGYLFGGFASSDRTSSVYQSGDAWYVLVGVDPVSLVADFTPYDEAAGVVEASLVEGVEIDQDLLMQFDDAGTPADLAGVFANAAAGQAEDVAAEAGSTRPVFLPAPDEAAALRGAEENAGEAASIAAAGAGEAVAAASNPLAGLTMDDVRAAVNSAAAESDDGLIRGVVAFSDPVTGELVPGAEVQIQTCDGEFVGDVPLARGAAEVGLTAGCYQAVLTKAPAGYELDATPVYFDVAAGAQFSAEIRGVRSTSSTTEAPAPTTSAPAKAETSTAATTTRSASPEDRTPISRVPSGPTSR